MIEVKDAYKSFRDKPVLRGVNLRIETGESVTIIGQSGGGKSVLLKHLVGLLLPDAGDILVDGQTVAHARRRELYHIRKKFGVLFQGAALFDSMTVAENISLPLQTHLHLSDAEINERVEHCLQLVSLDGTQTLKPAELSGGMRKRVGLARAIAMQPKYILYDEPTTGLDPITADSINDLIIRMNEELHVTTVVVTHDMVSAYKVSDRIVMIHEGKIIWSGTPKETQETDHEVVHRFVTGQSDESPPKIGEGKHVITRYD
jgi:phospholipid/cholesterol/gamma-HCH transport system ATP-binding protein